MIFYCINLHHASIIHIVYIFFSFFRFLPLVLLWHVIPIWSQLIPTCPIGLVPSLRSSLARCLIVGRLLWFCLSSLSSFSGINPHFFLGSYFSVCQADCCSWKLPFLRSAAACKMSCKCFEITDGQAHIQKNLWTMLEQLGSVFNVHLEVRNLMEHLWHVNPAASEPTRMS